MTFFLEITDPPLLLLYHHPLHSSVLNPPFGTLLWGQVMCEGQSTLVWGVDVRGGCRTLQ